MCFLILMRLMKSEMNLFMNKTVPYIERVALLVLLVGIAFNYFNINASNIIIGISLSGLAIAYFLSAFKPTEVEPSEGEQLEFKELLGMFILPKVIWISLTVSVIGILLYYVNIGNNGYLNMLYLGGSTMVFGIIVLLLLKLTGTKYINQAFPVLLRAIPILVVMYYIAFMN